MTRWRQGLFIAAIGLGLGSLGWRLLSRRHSLPCPVWLIALLENPFTQGVAGRQLVERLRLAPGMQVLDVGCGPGRLLIPTAQVVGPSGQVVGIDIQAGMLQHAQQRVTAAALANVELRLLDITRDELAANHFDRALLVTVLGEIPDRAAALGAIYWALKPGGMLAITEVLPDPHYQTLATVRRFARQAGFVEADYWGGWLTYTINLVKP